MIVRTYIDKANTIVSNNSINTGKNPVSELFYGVDGNGNWTYSRLLLHFDLPKLVKQFKDGMLGDLSKVKHKLKLINTGSFHDDLLNKETYDGKKRTSSFKLVAYELPALWDEGVGYDYQDGEQTTTSTMPSNWFNATTSVEWPIPGAKSINPKIAEARFPDGNEDLEMDLTTVINNLILNYNPDIDNNYGFAIAFESDLEDEPLTLTKEDRDRGIQYVGFFTNNTQTFYEPFIETHYADYIRDDRGNFYLDKPNRLYLYVNANGEPRNLDILPTVTIMDDMGDTLPLNLTVVQEKKGVYSVEVELNLVDFRGPAYYSDIWSNINIDGAEMGDVQMGFEIQNGKTFYDIGMGVERPKDYQVVISGIRNNESIKRGDVRRIKTNAMIPYTVDQKVLLDGINYRLYVKEGTMEHTVFDYEPVERSYKDNYILLDTDSLIPNVYYLDIQMISNQEVKTTKEVIKFKIVE